MAGVCFYELEELRRTDAEKRRRFAEGDKIDFARARAAKEQARFRPFANEPDALKFDNNLPLSLDFHKLLFQLLAKSFVFSANCVKIFGEFPHILKRRKSLKRNERRNL
jgi:hypothetical protein